jgi:hypothetical protein
MSPKRFRTTRVFKRGFTLALSFSLVIFYLYQDFRNWPLMTFLKAQGPMTYVDSHTVLFYSRCFSQIGSGVFAADSICPNWGYGSGVLRFLSFFDTTEKHAALFGHFFTYSIVITFVYLIYVTRSSKFVQATLFMGLISPPVWLLMERANFDAIIYLMIFLAAVLFGKGYEAMPIILIFITATFKFYTLPLLLICVMLCKKISNKVLGILALVLGTIFAILDLNLMSVRIIQAGNNHFGMKIIGNYLGKIGFELDILRAYLLGALLLTICVWLIYYLLSRYETTVLNHNLIPAKVRSLYLFMSSAHLICFIAGLSVDYRLIFLLVSAPILIGLLTSRMRYFLAGFFLISAWLSYPAGILQTIGDLALEIVSAAQILFMIIYLIYAKKNLIR